MSASKPRARPGAIPKFIPYPEYKDSGVEWLGDVPAKWEAKRLKSCLQRLDSGGTPESGNLEYWTDDESGTPWVAISDMTRSYELWNTAKRLTQEGLRSKHLPVLPAGTLLYSMYASLGKVALLKIGAVVNQAILGLVTRDELLIRDYLRWWLEFMQGHVLMLSSSNTQDNLNAEKVRTMPVFVPGSREQRAIAAFLDRETARIDALVAKKERLIELLQEQRAAIITQVVTKGLDPEAPTTDSGSEWLEEIPAHWKVLRTDAFLIYEKDQVEPSTILDDLVFHYSIPSVQTNGDGALEPPTDIESAKLRILGERLLVSKLNPRKGVVLIASEKEVPTLCSSEFVPLKANGCDLRWALYLFSSETTRQRLSAVVRSATRSHQRAEIAEIVKMWHGVPPVPEQRAIAAFLDEESSRIDDLITRVRVAIERLHELRIALIAAAVTGKIDVRAEAA